MENEFNLIEVIKILNKYKLFIIAVVIIASLYTVKSTSNQPRLFRATATILAIQGSQNFSNVFATVPFGYSNYNQGTGIFGGLLKSRALAKNVIKELDLLSLLYSDKWDKKTASWVNNFSPSMESEAASLSGLVSINQNENGFYEISIVSKDPKLAADIANTYLKKLREYLIQNSLSVSFQIIDPALVPAGPFSTTDRKKTIMISAIIAFVVSVFLVFILNYLQEIKLFEKLKG